MTLHLASQRMLLPSAQVSSLTTGSITLPSARGAFAESDYESIASVSGTGSSSTLEITSIPSTYTHLRVIVTARTDQASNRVDGYMRFNSDSSSNYSYRWIYNSGDANLPVNSSQSADKIGLSYMPGSSATSNNYALYIIDIPDYANTSKFRTIGCITGFANRATSNEQNVANVAGVWRGGSAISTVTFFASAGSLTSNSKMSIYGLKG